MANAIDDIETGRMSEAAAPRVTGRVIDLGLAGKGNYVARRGALIELAWFLVEACVINNKLLPLSSVRVALLRLFGAKIGAHCRFVHPLRVKAPWTLEVGDNCWFGVDVWIYNQAPIRIGSNWGILHGSVVPAGPPDMRPTIVPPVHP